MKANFTLSMNYKAYFVNDLELTDSREYQFPKYKIKTAIFRRLLFCRVDSRINRIFRAIRESTLRYFK